MFELLKEPGVRILVLVGFGSLSKGVGAILIAAKWLGWSEGLPAVLEEELDPAAPLPFGVVPKAAAAKAIPKAELTHWIVGTADTTFTGTAL